MNTKKVALEGLLQNLHVEEEVAPLVWMQQFNAWFGHHQVLHEINLQFARHQINCIVGPSGGGKSTLIRCINRINDDIPGFCHQGAIYFNDRNIDAIKDATRLRTQIGMVFQKPCVFPKSIEDNVLFGVKFNKKLLPHDCARIVKNQLKAAALWEETQYRLTDPATSLSIGQQQRLCIARTLAVNPEVLLLDEPTSSLDPVSSRAIEDLMLQLKDRYSIIFVTHNILQAKRIADRLIFICDGRVIEQGSKDRLFRQPEKKQTWDYLNNEYCQC